MSLAGIVADYRLQARLMWEWRPTRLAIARRTILQFLVACLTLATVDLVLPEFQVQGLAAIALGGAMLAAVNAGSRLLGHLLLVRLPLLAVDGVGLLAQYVAILALGRFVPGIQVDGPGTAIWATVWLTALNGFLAEVVAVSDDDSYYSILVRRLVARRGRNAVSNGRGLLIVQLDGVGRPVLENAIRAGHVPVIGRLIRTGRSALHSWQPLLPPTTPASQAGILHGRADVVPGFRWYEKETGRLVVANHPDDAAEILRRISDGGGLLADDGASIGNLVSGDAPRSYLTMATVGRKEPSDDGRKLRGFFVGTVNYVRLFVLTLGEMAKELYQAERQRSRGISPRMHRGLFYALERALTNVALRTVSTSLVVEEMYRGAPVIYVDYTGYDAVAHHCGPQRQEAIDALEGIDRSIGSLLKAARHAARDYDLVALSDHGQSLGATFRQIHGQSLEAVVAALVEGDATVIGGGDSHEHTGGGRRVAGELGRGSGLAPFVARRLSSRTGLNRSSSSGAADSSVTPDVVVCSSGSLAHVYFAQLAGRMTREAIEQRYPGLIAGLVRHPGIGAVLAISKDGQTLVIGASGERTIHGTSGAGPDPLAQFGDGASVALASLDELAHLGDLILLGRVNPESGEVVGFEELVGSHGGLGGWQTQPFLMCPASWSLAADPLVGASAVHRQLRDWLV
ncbi:MAG TPA: phage holin family protein [Candidatus Limnocylindrales bacterium]